jgi:hypothetical protein
MASSRSTRRQMLTGGALLAAGAMAARLPATFGPAAAIAAEPSGVPVLPQGALSNADYWAFADWAFEAVDGQWNDSLGNYSADPRTNSGLLTAHAIAALKGYTGALRQDARALVLVDSLLASPPYRPGPPSGSNRISSSSQAHAPGWTSGMTGGYQQIAIDSKVAEGLVFAWRAREALGLTAEQRSKIETAVVGTASGPFFRFPGIRLNQINFPCELYAYAAELSGSPDLVVNDFREQLNRLLTGSRRKVSPWLIPNFGPSWSYHRDPVAPLGTPENIESAEYMNIVLETLLYYPAARATGMAPLDGENLEAARAIVQRAVPAYWTHSGYLNWDTGMYLQRWHLGRYWGFALQGLFAIAQVEELRDDDLGRWARWMFDRALSTYVRLAVETGGGQNVPKEPLFDVRTTFGVQEDDFATRFVMHAARAVYYDLQAMPSEQPPPLFAYDPPIGRLAVTTPTYNAAVVDVSNDAFPYGGIELARLYDAEQRIVGGVGGYGASGFGVMLTDADGTVLHSQSVRKTAPAKPPLTVTKSPMGAIRGTVDYPSAPYAGAFETLEYTGSAEAGAAEVEVEHTFASDRIVCRWTLTRRGGPELGAADGTRVAPRTRRRLGDTRRFTIVNGAKQGRYDVQVVSAPSDTVVTAVQVSPESSQPNPGPSLVLQLAPVSDWKRLRLVVEILPGAAS